MGNIYINKLFNVRLYVIALLSGICLISFTSSLLAQTGPNDDFDGDGIINSIDIDDDNDGILDTTESAQCTINNAIIGYWGSYPIAQTNMKDQLLNTSYYGTSGTYNKVSGITFEDVTTNLNGMTASQLYQRYKIINMSTGDPTAAQAQKLYDYVSLGGVLIHSYDIGLGSVLIQKFGGTGAIGTINQPTTFETTSDPINNGIFGDARSKTGLPNTSPSGIIFSSQLATGARILANCAAYSSVAGFVMGGFGTIGGRAIFYFDELQYLATAGGVITSNMDKYLNNIIAYALDSSFPQNGCGDIDTDGDSIPNRLDLDSDGDGCSDAFESGATASVVPSYQFTGPVGANGLVNSLETAVDNGVLNYTSTYSKALNNSIHTCPSCVAGTVAPALSSTTKVGVCPSTTVDLTSITASNLPAGTVLTWHTSSSASGVNKVTTPSAVAGGTYYASFFDSANNCYSPTSVVTATVASCTSGTIDCSKTQIYPAPIVGTPQQKMILVTLNVTTAGCFSPLTISGSGFSLANGVSQICTTSTGVQQVALPVSYDGSALSNVNFTIGSAGSCTADLTKSPKKAIVDMWTLDCISTQGPLLK